MSSINTVSNVFVIIIITGGLLGNNVVFNIGVGAVLLAQCGVWLRPRYFHSALEIVQTHGR